MSLLGFRGGPWDGFVIEYGESVRPEASVQPSGGGVRAPGRYLLDDRASAYVWAMVTSVEGSAT